MRPLNRILLLLVVALTAAVAAEAQRRVTPVEPTTGPTQKLTPEQQAALDKSRLAHRHDANGNIVLVDTVTGIEYHDTLATSIRRMIYPTVFRLSAGVNIWDLAMRCFNQEYGIGSVWVELNMHNRYFPYAEFGIGTADFTPDAANFTYKSPMAPYFKIGATYNMFYNSNPDYQFLAGFHYGFTPFKWHVDDITLNDTYWDETSTFSIPSRSSTAGYLEIVFGVKVKIVDRFSLGWNLIYHSVLHESKSPEGKPLYIPGFGKRDTHFTGTFSLIYTFDLNKPATPSVE